MDDTDDIEFIDSVRTLLQGMPEPVRNFVLYELSSVCQEMIEKYTLHIDQGGVLEQELLLMLAGEEDPKGFSKNLIDSGISAEVVRKIINDVNEQVFKKLRDQELADAAAAKQNIAYRTEPARAEVPVMRVGQGAPTAVPAASFATPATQTPTAAVTPVSTPIPSVPVAPASFNLVHPEPMPAVQRWSPAAQPEMRTMASDMQSIQHPELTVPVGTMPSIPHPSAVSPARSFQTASVPYTSMPVASAPVPPPSSQEPSVAPPKSYGVDPYRESPE